LKRSQAEGDVVDATSGMIVRVPMIGCSKTTSLTTAFILRITFGEGTE
jgi:hypothetical protein